MRSSNLSRNAGRAWWASALASWPLIASPACSVYDNSMLGDAPAPLGGSGADAGTGAVATAGSAADGGDERGGTSSAGSGGVATAGKAGAASQGGSSAGAQTPGGGGAAGNAAAGSAGDASGNAETIDDMEDGDAQIDISGRRNGYWYVGGDLTAGATLEPPPSKFAMTELTGDRSTTIAHIKATGFNPISL